MYLLGDGVEANPVEALKWYRSAADYGDSNAQGSLGVLYEHGVAGLSADARLAARWFAIAAKNGNERAAKHFERVSAKLNAEEKSAVERNAEMWKPKLAPRTSGISADDAARRLGDELGIDSADIAGALR
jgi:TPR repeat protein